MSDAFKGGEQLKQRIEEMVKLLGPGAKLQVGFLEGSTCGKNNDAPAPEIAYFNEFGTIGRQTLDTYTGGLKMTVRHGLKRVRERGTEMYHVPPRPFFRNMIAARHKGWPKLLAKALKKYKFNPVMSLSAVGLVMSEQLQASIKQFTDPKNADSTAKAKGFNKPLEDSKNMLNAVDYRVTLNANEGGEE